MAGRAFWDEDGRTHGVECLGNGCFRFVEYAICDLCREQINTDDLISIRRDLVCRACLGELAAKYPEASNARQPNN